SWRMRSARGFAFTHPANEPGAANHVRRPLECKTISPARIRSPLRPKTATPAEAGTATLALLLRLAALHLLLHRLQFLDDRVELLFQLLDALVRRAASHRRRRRLRHLRRQRRLRHLGLRGRDRDGLLTRPVPR